MTRTVVALYEDMPTAQQAVEELSNNGFDRAQISLVSQDAEGRYTSQTGDGESTGENIAEGVGVGAAVGGIGGLLVGLAALAIPGVGPIIAAGPLALALIGAGVGAATGGLIGALGESGVPPEQAEYYAEGVRRGGALVTAQVPDGNVDRAISILDRYDPIDIQRRASEWRSGGWTGFDNDVALSTDAAIGTTSARTPSSTGTMYRDTTPSLSTQTSTRTADQTLDSTQQVSGRLERPYAQRTEDTLGENIGYQDYDSGFRSHFQTNYSNSGYSYDQYEPAYRYGYGLVSDAQYRNRDWNTIESDARSRWEERNQGPWENFKDAVKHAWNEARGKV